MDLKKKMVMILLLLFCIASGLSLSSIHQEAVALATAGKLDLARNKFLLLAESTKDPAVFNDAGVIEMRLGFELLDAAIASFKRGLLLDPEHKELKTNLKDLNDFLKEQDDVASSSPIENDVLDDGRQIDAQTTEQTTEQTNTTHCSAIEPDPKQALVKKVMGTWLNNKLIKRYSRRAFGIFRPVQITNCFTPEFAKRLHHELYTTKAFKFYEGNTPFYQFRLNAIYDDDESFQSHPMLKMAKEALNSDTVMDWIADAANTEIEWASAGASLYKPGGKYIHFCCFCTDPLSQLRLFIIILFFVFGM